MRTRRARHALGLVIAYALLIGYAVLSLYPFLWMISGAFKTNVEIITNPGLIPAHPTADVLISTFRELNFGRYFLNSAIVTGAILAGIFTVYPMAAFAFATLDFRGRDKLFAVLVGMLFVPGVAILIPTLVLIQWAGLSNNWLGVIIPVAFGGTPTGLFLMRNYYRILPHEIFDAARVDGASNFAIYRRIYLPLSLPALTTVGIMSLIGAWSMFILPNLVLTDRELFTLPLGIFNLKSSAAPQWNVLMAASLIVVTPIVAAFLVLQRYYISGLTAGVGKT